MTLAQLLLDVTGLTDTTVLVYINHLTGVYIMFRKRHKIKRSKSKRLFRKTASRTNRRNSSRRVMRGGFRL